MTENREAESDVRSKLTLRSRDVSSSVRIEIWMIMLASSNLRSVVFSRSRRLGRNGVYTQVSQRKGAIKYISLLGFSAHRWNAGLQHALLGESSQAFILVYLYKWVGFKPSQ